MEDDQWIENIRLEGEYLIVPNECPWTPEEVLKIIWDRVRQDKKDMEKNRK